MDLESLYGIIFSALLPCPRLFVPVTCTPECSDLGERGGEPSTTDGRRTCDEGGASAFCTELLTPRMWGLLTCEMPWRARFSN